MRILLVVSYIAAVKTTALTDEWSTPVAPDAVSEAEDQTNFTVDPACEGEMQSPCRGDTMMDMLLDIVGFTSRDVVTFAGAVTFFSLRPLVKFASDSMRCLVLAATQNESTSPVSGVQRGDGTPSILDCSYSEEWNDFRRTFSANAASGFPYDDFMFQKADRLIAKNILTFLEFHRSKSNAFFHDCDREEPEGMVCLYGMLSALFVHHLYLRGNVEQPEPEEDDNEVFRLSTDLARLMIVNKNNCLDFFDSSNWPLTLAQLVATLKPTEVDKALRLEIQPERKFVPWLLPNFGSAAAALAKSSDVHGTSLVAYITGTHAALAREPAEMLTRFASSLLGIGMAAVMEVADDTHCGFLGCHPAENREEVEPLLPSLGLREMMGVGFQPVGLRELGQKHFRPRWTALDIVDLPGLLSEFQERFRQHSLSRAVDIAVCTSPAVLCLLLLPFNRPLLAYLGEPLLLSVDESGRDKWFEQFDSLATDPHHFFTCYNPFLSSMIEYQTGLILPTIRLHGLYTEASYAPSGRRGEEVLVIKGPNICTDSVCVLNKFLSNLLGQSSAGGTAEATGKCCAAVEDGSNYKLKNKQDLAGFFRSFGHQHLRLCLRAVDSNLGLGPGLEEQPDLNDVVFALQEGEALERRWALELLGGAAAERPGLVLELMKLLLQSLEDEDARVKKAAVEVFGQLGEHASDHTHEILDFLHDPDPEMRATAASALGDLGAWEHLEELRPCLSDSSPAVVRAALRAAEKWGENGQQLASSILECFANSARGVRCDAVKALASWADVGERLAGHVAELLHDPDNATREAAVAFFAAAGPRAARRAAAAAASCLSGPSAAAAAVALGHMQASNYAEQVASLLSSAGTSDVSLSLSAAGLEKRMPVELRRPECAAARSLMLMGHAGAQHADAVAALLVEPKGCPESMASLIRSLAGMGTAAHGHKGKIQSFLEHPHALVREAACHGVGLLAEAGVLGGEALLGRLGDSQACVRRAAARACGQLQELLLPHHRDRSCKLWCPFWIAILLENMASILVNLIYPDLAVASLNNGVDACAGSGANSPACEKLIAQASEIGATFGIVGAIMSLFAIPFVGSCADHFGRRPMLILAFLTSKVPLIALLCVAYAGASIYYFYAGLLVPVMIPGPMLFWFWINDQTEPSERGQMYGRLNAATNIEGIIVPLAAMVAHDRSAVLVLAVIRVAALLTVVCFVAESRPASLIGGSARSAVSDGKHAFFERWKNVRILFTDRSLRRLITVGLLGLLTGTGLGGTSFLYCKDKFGANMQTFAPLVTVSTVSNGLVQLFLLKPLQDKVGLRGLFMVAVIFGVCMPAAVGAAPTLNWMIAINVFSGLGNVGLPAFQAVLSNVSETIPGLSPGVALGALQAMSSVVSLLGPPVYQAMLAFALRTPIAGETHPGLPFFVGAALNLEPSLYVDAVAKLIEDSVPAVQAAALQSIAAMGAEGHAYAASICRIAVSGEKFPVNSMVRAAALAALGAMGDRGAAFAPEVASCFEVLLNEGFRYSQLESRILLYNLFSQGFTGAA
eukprot:s80_g12.t3